MDLNTRKELFSYAHIRSLAAAAGYSVTLKDRSMDLAGLDLTIEVPGILGNKAFPKVEAQVKCTADDGIVLDDSINFVLPVRNYNILRYPDSMSPLLLIVMLVPSVLSAWVEGNESETIIRKCAYWISLKGMPDTSNTASVTVRIPRQNLLTPASLTQLMLKVANEEDL